MLHIEDQRDGEAVEQPVVTAPTSALRMGVMAAVSALFLTGQACAPAVSESQSSTPSDNNAALRMYLADKERELEAERRGKENGLAYFMKEKYKRFYTLWNSITSEYESDPVAARIAGLVNTMRNFRRAVLEFIRVAKTLKYSNEKDSLIETGNDLLRRVDNYLERI